MFERYTEKARRVIFFARYEASQFGSERIETEHLLLGLLRETPEVAARCLEPEGAVKAEVHEAAEAPPEILESEARIRSFVRQMENAIANQDFVKARFYSEEERREREKLKELRERFQFVVSPEAGWSPTVESIRREIEAGTPQRERVSTSRDLPLSHESKRALQYAAEEAARLKHSRIDADHLLLGLMREEGCLAAEILKKRGLKLSTLRQETGRRAQPQTGGTDTGGIVFGGRSRPGAPGIPMPPGFAGSWMAAMQDAGRVLMLARHEASERNSACIETTDLLRAVAGEKEFQDRFPGPADSIGKQPRPAPEARRERVSQHELPFSEDCKLVFTLAAQEAARLGQRTGPVHLLLGILSVESCVAAEVLRDIGLTTEGVRAQLGPPRPPSDPEEGRSYV